MNRRHDYDLLEREYVTGDMSLRELARSHGITHSLIMEQSVKRGWSKKRQEYRTQSSERAVVYLADHAAMRTAREMQIRDNVLEAIDEAITKFRSDMRATERKLVGDEMVEVPVMRMRAAEVAMLFDRLLVLFGRPSQITEERSLGLTIDAGVGTDVLRDFIEATRDLGPDTGAASESPIPRLNRTRSN